MDLGFVDTAELASLPALSRTWSRLKIILFMTYKKFLCRREYIISVDGVNEA